MQSFDTLDLIVPLFARVVSMAWQAFEVAATYLVERNPQTPARVG
jgi:hypothetical protein